MILAATENGRRRNYSILLDRLFSPAPKRYRYADLQVNLTEKYTETIIIEEETPEDIEDDYATFFAAYQDSLKRLGIEQRVHQLGEVNVSARRRTQTQDIFHNRSTSVAYYDVASEVDDMYERIGYEGKNILELMVNMNKDFKIVREGLEEFLFYKGRYTLVFVNYEQIEWLDWLDHIKYQDINPSAIKSIYINESISVMAKYIIPPPMMSATGIASNLGCVVFIETYPDGELPVEAARGVRKTWLEGYSSVKEFYNPDYSILPLVPIPDYRRTLYWNPMVTTDEIGKVKVSFYNNSSCTDFSISAETVTSQGMIGIYKNEDNK